jgi:uncharacterized protein (TIGR00730 family)
MSQTTPKTGEQQVEPLERFDDLLRAVGGDPKAIEGKLVREMVHTALKLMRDGANTGELKLTSRSMKELRYAMKVFRPYQGVRKVAIFGSARTDRNHPDYLGAVAYSRAMAQRGWMVITGGGGGIMRAGHGGAGRAASFGVAIRLPFEKANDIIEGDPKLIVFRYFFTRKLIFVSQAHAVVLFPGGFGTMDEGFETLTLIQTGKAPLVPVVMINSPGERYWHHWDRFVREELLARNLVGADDLSLYHVTDDVASAEQHVLHFYRNYESQRFVRDDLVIRMHRPLTEGQVGQLNEQFADLVAAGRIAACGPQAGERKHLDLPRLKFAFTRRGYGRLRQMIDRINDFDLENEGATKTAGGTGEAQ